MFICLVSKRMSLLSLQVSVDDPTGPSPGCAPLTAIKIIGSSAPGNGGGLCSADASSLNGPSCYTASCGGTNGSLSCDGGHSRQSLASSSISTSPLDSSSSINTSVTTISYGPPASGSYDVTDTTTSSSTTTVGGLLGGNRNSFHVSPPFIHPPHTASGGTSSTTAAAAAAKIRRCQSDVAGSVRLGSCGISGICRGAARTGDGTAASNNACALASVHRQASQDEDTMQRNKRFVTSFILTIKQMHYF